MRFDTVSLTAEAAANAGGFSRAAGYLLKVTEPMPGKTLEETREILHREGNIRANVTGARFADGIDDVVRSYLQGTFTDSYTRRNAQMLERERAARLRTGRFVPETTERAFGSDAGSAVRS